VSSLGAGAGTTSDAQDRSNGRSRRGLVSLAKAGSFSMAGQLIQALMGSGFLVLLSHALPQTDTGAVVEAIAVFGTAALIGTCGADVGLMWVLPKYRHSGPDVVRKVVLVACLPTLLVASLLAAILFLLAPSIAHLLVHSAALEHPTTFSLRLLAPLIPLAALTAAILAGSRTWGIGRSVFVQYLLVPSLRPLLLGFALLVGVTSITAAAAWGIPVLVGFLAALLVLVRIVRSSDVVAGPESETPVDGRHLMRTFWRFSSTRSLDSVLVTFLATFDVVMVGILGSPKIAASYAVATRYVAIGLFGLQAVLVVIPAQFSDLMHRGLID